MRRTRSDRATARAGTLGVVPRAVTPQIDALEEAGLVRRRTDPGNRRSILLDLTGDGRTVREQLRQARVRAADDIFSGLTAAQRGALLDLLEAATASGS